MRKMFKAAASLAVGCAMLSTSAFAALTGEPVLNAEKTVIDVTVGGLGVGESTILVLKGEHASIPASLADADIVYINQVTADSNGNATYSMPLGARADGAEKVTVFGGGTNETSATKLGVLELASSSTLPEGTQIAIRNSDPYGMTGYSVVSITGIDSGSVKIKDADGNTVDAFLADYSAFAEQGGVKKYVALVKGTTFTAADITYDPAGTAETVAFGDVISSQGDPTGYVDIVDTTRLLDVVAKVADLADNKAYIAADLNADGVIDILDVTNSLDLVAKVIVITNAAK